MFKLFHFVEYGLKIKICDIAIGLGYFNRILLIINMNKAKMRIQFGYRCGNFLSI